MGRGGVTVGLVPKKAKIGSEVDFRDFAKIGPPGPGPETHLRISTELSFDHIFFFIIIRSS